MAFGRTWRAAAVGVLLSSFVATATFGQTGGGAGGGALLVPITECNCSLPHDYDECCVASQTWCRRLDSTPVVVFGGTAVTISAFNICSNCNEESDPGCPENPPSGSLTCGLAAKLSQSQTATATVDSRITVGVPGVEASIGSALGTAVGVTVEVSSSCSYSVEPCKAAKIYGSLVGTLNKSVEMDHSWTTGGTWISVGYTCPIAGGPWSQPCGSGTSTGTANLWGDGTCTLVWEQDCATVE